MTSELADFRFWFLTLFVFLSVPLGLTQTSEKQLTNATIRGRVTWRGKGVSDCSVMAWDGPYTEVNERAVPTKTDAEGYFRLSVSPGNYYVWIDAPNYYVVADGRPSLKPIQVAVERGEELSGLNVNLERGGVVTGKVTNADNTAAIDLKVSLIPLQESVLTVGTTRALWATGVTDDRGIYRLYGIPPGEYRVAAGDISAAHNAVRGRPAVPRTFFPDSLVETKAKTVTVVVDTEVAGIDIKLPAPKPVFVVSGRVIDGATGTPVPNVGVGIRFYEGTKSIGGRGGGNPTNERGEYQIDGVPGGRYSLYVPSANQRVENFGETEQFDVVDQDVSNIVITTSRMASVSGTVSVEGNGSKELLRLIQSTRFIAMTVPSGQGRGSSQVFTINDDGTFEVTGLLPGKLNINFVVRAGEKFPSLRVLRLEREGRRDPVELNAGDKLSGIRLVIVEATSSIKGYVRLFDGSRPANFSGSASLYLDQVLIGWAPLDSRGHFLLENQPAGSFRLAVAVSIPGHQSIHYEQNIVLTNNATLETNVLIDPKPTPTSARP